MGNCIKMQSWHLQIASLDEELYPTQITNDGAADVNTENGAVKLRFIDGQRKPSFADHIL